MLLLVKERLVLLDLSLVNGSVCHTIGSIAGCYDRHRQEKEGRKSLQESVPRHLWKISGWVVLGLLLPVEAAEIDRKRMISLKSWL